MSTEERTITIVDDIMGSGKSTWAINYINDNPDRKFLCIVPLLSECERFKDGTDIDIVDPEKWGSKWKHFRWLVENEKNIVTTHSLIQKMDLDMLELLKSKDYVLIIDECLDVLDTYKITKDDELANRIEKRYGPYGVKFTYEDAPEELQIEKVKDRKPPEGKNQTNAQKIIAWREKLMPGTEYKVKDLLEGTGLSNNQFQKVKSKNSVILNLINNDKTSKKGFYKVS